MHNDLLADYVRDASQRILDLVADFSTEQLMGPLLPIVNPPIWEIGHTAWFHEKWVLRHLAGEQPIRRDADVLYDSAAVAHDTRWSLPLPSPDQTFGYLRTVRDRVLLRLSTSEAAPEDVYFNLLSVFHEDMHAEALTYTRQTLNYPAPTFTEDPPACPERNDGPLPGDAALAGGTFMLGAARDEPFMFDNEKWAHPVSLQPFLIARAAVTQEEFARFVDDGGYQQPALWTTEGWRWRQQAGASHPVYWRRSQGGWERRSFDTWVSLEVHRPVLHVNWYEADAYCRWAGRRLPTEAEWEMAASWDPAAGQKRRFPWGDTPPSPETANLDWRGRGAVDVGSLAAGDSPCGCRQMIGNVWEWTSTSFAPYPGFVVDPYKEYSEPWFYDHMVLRGGCWTTRSRLIRNTWRNFYKPDRRDVWAGFRTCAL